jgi:hypothetical protein
MIEILYCGCGEKPLRDASLQGRKDEKSFAFVSTVHG